MPAARPPALLCIVPVLVIACGVARGADVDLARALEQNSHEIRLQAGELAGDGRGFILQATRGAQFVALGEEHNNRDIPPFAAALFRLLRDSAGFQYLATEQDPVMMERVATAPVRGDDAAITALAARYLMGFTFDSDQELAMLAQIGALSSGRGRPVWGCDQAFGVTHILDELLPYAAGASRIEVEALRTQAAQAEATRDLGKRTFMQSEALAAAVPKLRAVFPAAGAPRAAFLVETLAKSSEIYQYYLAGDRGEVPGYYSNNAVREEYLKSRFLAEYRYAGGRDRRPPKVLLKFGGYHLYRGLSPTSVPSLGNFVNDFARAHDSGFFSILTVAFGAADAEGSKVSPTFASIVGNERTRFLKAFAPAADPGRWTLLDLRPFREYPYYRALRGSVPDLTDEGREELHRLLYGYDALLLIGGSAPATHEATHVEY